VLGRHFVESSLQRAGSWRFPVPDELLMAQFLGWTERHLTLGIRSGLDIAANGA
jgi:hypothetical protein